MNTNEITGSGKGGGGYKEDPNSLNSITTVSTLEVLSCGPIKGLVNDQKSIYFDGIPVEATDGSKNYEVQTDIRLGLPSQAPMTGFPQAEAIIEVNSDINDGIDAIYTASANDVDRMRLGIALPSGLYWQGSNGITKTDIEIDIFTAGEDGVYTKVATWSKIGEKTMSPYLGTIDITRPTSSGLWSVKLVKKTPPYGDEMHNDAKLASVTEIKDVQLSYDNFAYVGLKLPANEVSNKNPERLYHVDGLLCKVPSNYDPIAGTYSGEWDSTFKTEWTDNPVWILYDLLTNETYGSGRWVRESDIDIYSFYDASVYCDGLVPDGAGGQERRFTFNGVLNQQDSWLTVLQQVASNFNAVLIKSGTLWRLQQDRPTPVSNVITNADVIDGIFTYSGSQHQHRHTLVNVTYQDKNNLHKKQIVTVEAAPSDIERYNGYTTVDIAAIGCDRESQAIRVGKWYIDTELNQLETVNFAMSFNGMLIDIGDVIKVADTHYSTLTAQGKILGVEGDDLLVDRNVSYVAGDKISFLTASGQYAEVQLTSSGTNTNRVQLPYGMGNPTGQSFCIESAVKNRQFRVTSISETAPNELQISAIQHDPNKYARIEQGVSVVAPPYSTVNNNRAKQVTNITFVVDAYNDDGVIRRDLVVSFTPPLSTPVLDYTCEWRSNGGAWTTIKTDKTSFDIHRISEGTYDVRIVTNATNGTKSAAATATYEYSLSGGTGSLLNPVANLYVLGTTSTQFNDNDLVISWLNPITNTSLLGLLKDFRIDIKDADDNILRTEYAAAVQPDEYQQFTYSYLKNKNDHSGTANRSLKVTVYCRDSNNKLSTGVTKTFLNPAPAAPAITSTSGTKSIKIEVLTNIDRALNPDYVETAFFVSDSPTFTPTLEGAVARGQMSFYMLQGVETKKYFAVAFVDSFGDPLNWSLIGEDEPGTPAGVPEVTVLPNSPADVDGHTAVMYKAPGTNEYIMYGWDGTQWMNTRDGGFLVDYSVVASKIYAEDLRAISAHLGDMESGSITFDQASYIRGGALNWTTGTGVWTGYHDNNYKFRVGSPVGAGLDWDGTKLTIYDNSHNVLLQSGTGLVVDFANVVGATKPANNATVGAPSGTYVGSTLAQTVESNSAAAKQAIDDMASDAILSPVEKQIARTELDNVTAMYNQLDASASQLGIYTERSNHSSYYSILYNYVQGLIANTSTSSNINAATWRANWSNYYTAKELLQKKISKVANDAGAVVGTNLYVSGSVASGVVSNVTPITGTNIGTYMSVAAIKEAYIEDANIGTLKIKGNAVTVPSGGTGIYSASASINLPQPGYITVIGTFTQGTGKGGHTWRLYVGGTQVAYENPAVSTTGAMSTTIYVGAGGQSCAIQCDQTTGDGRCAITVLGSMR